MGWDVTCCSSYVETGFGGEQGATRCRRREEVGGHDKSRVRAQHICYIPRYVLLHRDIDTPHAGLGLAT